MTRILSLRRDQRGSTFIVGALALMVILAMVGGGLDLGRAYLTRLRLQQACDAGVLAGRAELSSAAWEVSGAPVADAVFAENYPAGTYGVTNLAHTYTSNGTKNVGGSASADVPTTLMRIFGYDHLPVSVTCTGETQLANADIMFVLDTTTSMNDTNPGDTKTKIVALQEAVAAFYNVVEASKAEGAQVRYGFVPFGANVNVGGLLKPEWMANSWTYWSRYWASRFKQQDLRRYAFDSQASAPNADGVVNDPQPLWVLYQTENLVGEGGTCPVPLGDYTRTDTNNTDTAVQYYNSENGNYEMLVDYVRVENGTAYSYILNSNGTCTIYTRTLNNVHTYWRLLDIWWPADDPRRYQTYWHHGPVTYDVSPVKTTGGDGFLTGTGLVTVPIGNANTSGDRTVAWRGCIEERQTVATDINASTGIPAAAYDLNIDLVPDPGRPETLWGPSLPHLVFMPSPNSNDFSVNLTGRDSTLAWINMGDWPTATMTANYKDTLRWSLGSTLWDQNGNALIDPTEGDSLYARCPSPARRLAEIDSVDTVTNYINNLALVPFTYHDIGMIWGARLLSAEGLFKDDNQHSKNGGPITRHLILMTDGNIEVDIANVGPYGLEPYDHRRQAGGPIQSDNRLQPAKDALTATVSGRFQAICKAARGKFTVWVISFGSAVNADTNNQLKACASPNSFFTAANANELTTRFLDIAGRIASLRLSQ